MKKATGIALGFAVLVFQSQANAAVYDCVVSKKIDPSFEYSQSRLDEGRFSVIIHDEKTPRLERCSMSPSKGKVTCDAYVVDRVENDTRVGIKKFYVFGSQFDVQIFRNQTFVENNGRGGISYGQCSLVKP